MFVYVCVCVCVCWYLISRSSFFLSTTFLAGGVGERRVQKGGVKGRRENFAFLHLHSPFSPMIFMVFFSVYPLNPLPRDFFFLPFYPLLFSFLFFVQISIPKA